MQTTTYPTGAVAPITDLDWDEDRWRRPSLPRRARWRRHAPKVA